MTPADRQRLAANNAAATGELTFSEDVEPEPGEAAATDEAEAIVEEAPAAEAEAPAEEPEAEAVADEPEAEDEVDEPVAESEPVAAETKN